MAARPRPAPPAWCGWPGQEVFKHAVVKLAQTGAAALDRAGLGTTDVDWLVPHQASLVRKTSDDIDEIRGPLDITAHHANALTSVPSMMVMRSATPSRSAIPPPLGP